MYKRQVSDDSALISPIFGATPFDVNRTILSTNPAFVFDHLQRQATLLDADTNLQNATGARVFTENLTPNVFYLDENRGVLLTDNGMFEDIESPLLDNVSGGSLITISPHEALWLGGTIDGSPTRDGLVYDGRDQSIRRVSNLLSEARENPTTTVVGQKLLVVGGRAEDDTLSNTIDVIEIENFDDSERHELPEAISGFALLPMPNGQALIMGGKNEQGEATNRLLVYNPAPRDL